MLTNTHIRYHEKQSIADLKQQHLKDVVRSASQQKERGLKSMNQSQKSSQKQITHKLANMLSSQNTGDASFYARLNEQPAMLKTSSFSRMIKMRQSATA